MTVVDIARRPVGRIAARLRTRERVPLTSSAAMVLAATGALLAGGLIMILSSSWVAAYDLYGSSFMFFARQATWAAFGVLAMIALGRMDYRKTRLLGYVLAAIALVGLVAVLIPGIGIRAGGSSRWIGFGPMRFQPSELAKLALVLVCADLCVRKGPRLRTLKEILVPVGIIAGVFAILVLAQPDLGTTVMLAAITITPLYLAGARMRVMMGVATLATAAGVLLAIVEPYRRARLLSFLNPFSDPLVGGYQAVQGQIALGSGGLFGVGLGAGRQKWLYLPNAHTDFIYSVIGEEVGLFGTLAVLGLFLVLIYAGVRIARRAPDTYGRLLAGTITTWIGGQALINMGAVTGLLPITGIPLPFVSFGGSSLVFTLAAVGLLLSIARRESWPGSNGSLRA